MRSMIKIASIFKDETDKKIPDKGSTNSLNYDHSTNEYSKSDDDIVKCDNSPTFFIN